MLITGKEDLRVQKTIAAIKEAFEALICEKDYENITVTELCARSMINKKTFYHYYPTLNDLLAELQMELSVGYIERVKDFKLPEELEKVNREFFLYSESQGLAYEKITCASSYSQPRQEMIEQVMEATWAKSKAFKKLDVMKQRLVLDFINTTCVEAYRQWVAGGKQIPLDEMVELTNTLICGGTDRFFQKIK